MEGLKYAHMDARGLTFPDGLFDVVIDKGCLDCMVCTEKDSDATEFIDCTLREASRVLKQGGYFCLISCGINSERMASFKLDRLGWKIEAHEVLDTEGRNFVVYATVARKIGR